MNIRKAVITAAGKKQQTLPLQTLVDRDGISKSALAILIEEVTNAGIEEIAVIISPGAGPAYATATGAHARRVQFIEQPLPLGYGHAVHCAAKYTGSEPFLLLVGDHLYLSNAANSCARQLIETAHGENCSVSAVQATHESKLPYYGAVGGSLVAGRQRLYEVEAVCEKPTPTEAEQTLVVPGLRAGHYLCFFGMHILTPVVMEILDRLLAGPSQNERVQLSTALSELARRERYLASELLGRRHDIGERYGLLTAQLALALAGENRDEILTQLVELLAQNQK